MQIHSVNFLNEECRMQIAELKLKARYRHQGDLISVKVLPVSRSNFKVFFQRPQKAIASGQSLVLYKGRECVGGGVIV